MYVCYVCMYLGMSDVCMHVCMYVCMYLGMSDVCMYVMYVCI